MATVTGSSPEHCCEDLVREPREAVPGGKHDLPAIMGRAGIQPHGHRDHEGHWVTCVTDVTMSEPGGVPEYGGLFPSVLGGEVGSGRGSGRSMLNHEIFHTYRRVKRKL